MNSCLLEDVASTGTAYNVKECNVHYGAICCMLQIQKLVEEELCLKYKSTRKSLNKGTSKMLSFSSYLHLLASLLLFTPFLKVTTAISCK